jgi:hypothetical protein
VRAIIAESVRAKLLGFGDGFSLIVSFDYLTGINLCIKQRSDI